MLPIGLFAARVRLGDILLETDDPPVRALFLYAGNPLASAPRHETVRRGLARDDLFVSTIGGMFAFHLRRVINEERLPTWNVSEGHLCAARYGGHPSRDLPTVAHREHIGNPASLAKQQGSTDTYRR